MEIPRPLRPLEQVASNIAFTVRRQLGLENYLSTHLKLDDPQYALKRFLIQSAWQSEHTYEQVIRLEPGEIPVELSVLPDVMRVVQKPVNLRILLIIPDEGLEVLDPSQLDLLRNANYLLGLRQGRRGVSRGEIRYISKSRLDPSSNTPDFPEN